MPVVVAASTQPQINWQPRDKDLKTYLHFDRLISKKDLVKLANDPQAVARHSFFPLIRFYESWKKFRKGETRKRKVRPLRYAARCDAAIFARYRTLLAEHYEAALRARNLCDVPVAYRKIKDRTGRGKSNIEIARDVFEFIRETGDCIVTVVDIKSYFESLDHNLVLDKWRALLGAPLTEDHMAVYKALTKYSVVDYEPLIKRLKLLSKVDVGNRAQRRCRRVDALRRSGWRQFCTPQQFRELVAGRKSAFPSLIQKNGFDFGIPQGTPLSDLVANFYLLDFDQNVQKWVSERQGLYRRYSDDIIVVVPSASIADDVTVKNYLQCEISNHGRKLVIQDRKVSIVKFAQASNGILFQHVFGEASRNGLEYLGFEFDGRAVKLRNSTLSNAWRKMKRQAHGHAASYVKRYKLNGSAWIRANYPIEKLETAILRDVTFNQDNGYESWTFIKYVRRASRSFTSFDTKFANQTKRYRRYTRTMIEITLDKAIKNHIG